MDDDSCILKYIEIVPLDKSEDSSNVTDVKVEPLSVKVSVVFKPWLKPGVKTRVSIPENPCVF